MAQLILAGIALIALKLIWDVFHLIRDSINQEEYVILPKVRLEEIILSAPNVKNAEEYLHRLKERSADFLVCSLPSLKPQLVILGEGNNTKKKQLTDKFNKRACEEAGLAVMSVNTSDLPSSSELTSRLKEMGVS